jgi:phosphoglucomutase
MNTTLQDKLNSYLAKELHPEFLALGQALKTANDDTLNEYIGQELTFGTAGLRGLLGPGFNRINPFIIRRASMALAHYMLSQNKETPIAVVAYDSRRYSHELALDSALVFATCGIKTHLFQEPTPVPILSYTIRKMQAHFGVMITASHNPKEYNGYKVYWSDGGQIVSPHDAHIEKEIQKITSIATITENEAITKNILMWLDQTFLNDYVTTMRKLFLRTALTQSAHFKIAYSPLHGSGLISVKALMETQGFQLLIPPAQALPDGEFPTIPSPNPEDPRTLDQAIALAKEKGASLVLATDPDADRVGVAVLHQGDYHILNGNEIGVLLLDYLCLTKKEFNCFPANGFFVNSVVTTPLQNKIATYYGLHSIRVLTGFKNISDAMTTAMAKGQQFVFGCEESFGYLCHPYARDKDAISACLLLGEATAYYASTQRTLLDRLHEIYLQFGFYAEKQLSFTFLGLAGIATMKKFTHHLRTTSLTWDDLTTQRLLDHDSQQIINGSTITPDSTLLKTDMLVIELTDGTTISVRPSGTEPKIKFYIMAKHSNNEALQQLVSQLSSAIKAMVSQFNS